MNVDHTTPGVTGDLALLERVRARDESTVAECYDRYSGAVLEFVTHYVESPEEAQRIARRVFVEVWQSAPPGVPPAGSIPVRLFVLALSHLTDRRSDQVASDAERWRYKPPRVIDTEPSVTAARSAVVEAFSRLKSCHRDARLLASSGLRPGEVAEVLEASNEVALTQLRVAVVSLRSALAEAQADTATT